MAPGLIAPHPFLLLHPDGGLGTIVAMAKKSPEKHSRLTEAAARRLGRLIETEFERDAHKFESGSCPEFALALHQCIPGSSLVVCARSWEEMGDESTNELSHVVVEKGEFDFDAGGSDASVRWEERWEGDYSDKPDESVSFSWQEVSEKTLTSLVAEHRTDAPNLNLKMVEKLCTKLSKIVDSVLPQPPPLPVPSIARARIRPSRRSPISR